MSRVIRSAVAGLIAVSGAVVLLGGAAPQAVAAPAVTTCGSTPSSGYVTTLVGTGLSTPVSVAVDTHGNVFVGEQSDGGHVQKFIPSGASYTKTTVPNSFNIPYGVAVDDSTGTVWVTNSAGNHLVRMMWDGSTYHTALSGPSGIFVPGDVAVDSTGHGFNSAGTAFVASAVSGTMSGVPSGHQILMLSESAPWTTSVVRDTTGDTWGIAVGPDGRVYNTEGSDKVVRSRWATGTWSSITIPTTGLSSPRGLAVGADNVVYVADSGNDRIVALTPSGGSYTQSTLPITGLDNPMDIAVGADGALYIVDNGNNRVLKATPAAVVATADTASTTLGHAVTTTVKANDSVTGSTLGDPAIAKNPQHGTATVDTNGTIIYTPAAGFSGTDTYQYSLADTTGSVCDTATVTVTVTQGNVCDPLGTTGGSVFLPVETDTEYPGYFDVAADGTIFVTDAEKGEIVTLTPTASGYDRAVVVTGMGNMTSIAVADNGDLWVVRYPGQVLRFVRSGSTYTIAGSYHDTLLSHLGGIDVAPNGTVVVSINATSFGSGGVVVLDTRSGLSLTQIVSGLDVPHQVAVDSSGAVYVATYTSIVKAVDSGSGWTSSEVVTGLGSAEGVTVDNSGTIWIGTGEDEGLWTATPSDSGYNAQQIYAPWGHEFASTVIVGDDGTVYVSSFNDLWSLGSASVHAVDDTATVTAPQTVTTDVRANDAASVPMASPIVASGPTHGSAAVNSDGTISYTPAAGFSGTDSYTYRVGDAASPPSACGVATVTITVAPATACQSMPSELYVTAIPQTIANLNQPAGVVVAADGTEFIADEAVSGNAGKIVTVVPYGTPTTIDSTSGIDPQGIALDAAGNVYYADEGEHEIVKLTKSASTYTRSVLATGLQRPSGIAVDATGNVYFSENSSGHVHKLTPNGSGYVTSLVGYGLERPRGVAVDAQGNVFVADWSDGGRIVEFTPAGASYTKATVALGLDDPYGVAVQPDGTLIVGDSGNNRLLRLVPDGTGYDRTQIAVWGSNAPTWVSTTSSGNLVVTDHDLHRMVMLHEVSVTAADDTASTSAGTPVNIAVRDNDTSSPADAGISPPTLSGTPVGGDVTIESDRTITYTPHAGFSGTGIVRYVVGDDMGTSVVCAEATVRITVTNGFAPKSVTTPQNTAVTTALEDLASTTGKPLDPAHMWSMNNPQHGSIAIYDVSWDRPIRVTYTPDAGYSGPDSYVLNLCDQSDPQQCADVTIPVTVGANTVTATDGVAATTLGVAVGTDVAPLVTSASGQALAAPTVTGAPSHGSTSVSGSTITYTPAAGFAGTDSYTYRVCDTGSPSVCDSAVVTIAVANVVTPGTSGLSTPQNHAVTMPLTDIAASPGAPLDPASVTQTSVPAHGSLAIDPATGAVTYTPTAGYSGTDSFEVRVCDSATTAHCVTRTVGVTVTPNTLTVLKKTLAAVAGGPVTFDVLGSVSSSSGQPLAALRIAQGPRHGSAQVNANGSVTYQALGSFHGTDELTVAVCDTGTPQVCTQVPISIEVEAEAAVAVLPPLPDTGGPRWGWLPSGAALLLAGLLLMRADRRRA